MRDNEVKAAMLGLGVHCQSFNGDVLYEPWEVLGEGGRPLTSFDSFWGRCAPPTASLSPSWSTTHAPECLSTFVCCPQCPILF